MITSEFLDILEYGHRTYTNNDKKSQYNAQRYIPNKKIKSNFVSLKLIIVWRDTGVNTSNKMLRKSLLKPEYFLL